MNTAKQLVLWFCRLFVSRDTRTRLDSREPIVLYYSLGKETLVATPFSLSFWFGLLRFGFCSSKNCQKEASDV